MNAVGPGACIILVGGLASLARADFPIFTEEAAQRGVNYTVTDGAFGGSGQYGCGVALVDLDNDGDDDLIATGNSAGQIALFANDGTGHFVDRTASSGLPAVTKVSGVVAGDYDGDGDLDLFITRWLAPAMLFRNEGGLFFANATSQALLTGISGAGAGCSFGDFDGDGDLDLAIAMRTNTNSNMMRNRFYRNNGNGTFTDISVALGVDDGFASFQCILQDLDRDGDCDLYVSNDKGMPGVAWNRYFRNEGGVFTEELDSGACIAIDSMGVC
ncbi:MAG: FG-GAP-like repeat-containing protein, partial [Phycisphaerales bacterium]